MDIRIELETLPKQIEEKQRTVETTYKKVKLLELKLSRLRSKAFIEMKEGVGHGSEKQIEAKLELKLYRKERNLKKLQSEYRVAGIELDYLRNSFSAIKRLAELEAGNGKH